MSLDEQEQWAKKQLIALQEEYHARAKPFVDMLANIASLRPPPPIYLDQRMIDNLPQDLRDQLRKAAP